MVTQSSNEAMKGLLETFCYIERGGRQKVTKAKKEEWHGYSETQPFLRKLATENIFINFISFVFHLKFFLRMSEKLKL